MKIDDKTKELIAIGASIVAHCQPCLQYHVARAQRAGADAQEMADAIAIAQLVRKGAGIKMDTFTANLTGATPAVAAVGQTCCG
jgi:AhpD family alkylhydroperoxidase